MFTIINSLSKFKTTALSLLEIKKSDNVPYIDSEFQMLLADFEAAVIKLDEMLKDQFASDEEFANLIAEIKLVMHKLRNNNVERRTS